MDCPYDVEESRGHQSFGEAVWRRPTGACRSGGRESVVADWDQLREFIHSNYKATDVSPRAVELVFQTAETRTQVVWVSFAEGPNGEPWAQIDSPIGSVQSIDLVRALHLMENAVCGGLCHVFARGQDLVSIRHCVPLDNLDEAEFTGPLRMVTGAADAFENELTGLDSV